MIAKSVRDLLTLPRIKIGFSSEESISAVSDAAKSIVLDRELEQQKKPSESEPPRIRCPLCGWSRRKEDKWFCTCGFEWNTFDTGGVCAACLHQRRETQCLSCSRWSPHSDSYAQ
jgi:hypothetical protein